MDIGRIDPAWLFRYRAWLWLLLGAPLPSGRFEKQPEPYMPMRQVELPL